MTENNLSKYLFCMVPTMDQQHSLASRACDFGSELLHCYYPSKTKLPFHITVLPPFTTFKPAEMIGSAHVVVKRLYDTMLSTKSLDVFYPANSTDTTQIVLRLDESNRLKIIHERMLPILEIYRVSTDSEKTTFERRYGSNFVANNYSPHITMLNLPAGFSVPEKFKAKIGETYNLSLRGAKLTLLRKAPSANWTVDQEFSLN